MNTGIPSDLAAVILLYVASPPLFLATIALMEFDSSSARSAGSVNGPRARM